MTKQTNTSGQKVLSLKNPEPRFPKAAVDFIDALLTIQRTRFEEELAVTNEPKFSTAPPPQQPASCQIFAESDTFIGTGWSTLGHRKDGTAFRWMGRIGTLLLPIDLSKPRDFTLKGCGFTKRKFLKDATLWVDDQQIEITLSRTGFNRWSFSGTLPSMAARPYYILRIQSSGLSRLAEGIDAFVSLAVHELRINC